MDVVALLKEGGFKTTQMMWYPKQAPNLPYVVLVPLPTENMFADSRLYKKIAPYHIELYQRERDVPTEKRLEAILNEARIPWERYHSTDENGMVVIAVYTVTLTEE